MSESPTAAAPRITVLLFTDIVGSTALKHKIGDAAYHALLVRHNTLFEAGLAEISGSRRIKHTGDGYFARFDASSAAVKFALLFQSRMMLEPWGDAPLTTRLGIHVGEIMTINQAGQEDLVGSTADFAARLMSLGVGGQILLTRQAFDDARQFVKEGPAHGDRTPPLRWLAHGPYLFKGADEPIDVFEVGIERFSPLVAPPDGEKVKRVLRHDEAPVLGWRPAPGLAVPQRPNFALIEKLGEGGFGEVWLAGNEKLGEQHVFKFCFNAQRVRALKREFTLFRLLKEALGARDDIVSLLDYNLDNPPFFLESEFAAGGNLIDWADARGGFATLALDGRLDLLARVADAVAAAHSVGVLHKDIKPSNVLIRESRDGSVRPQLADFGIGFIADRTTIGRLDITESGFTQMTELADAGSTRTGTRMYAPPESILDRPYTQQGDVFSLGVMYYQFVIADLRRPLASGWERDVRAGCASSCPDDPLLCDLLLEDIAAATDGDAARRVPTAAALAEMLRTVRARHAERADAAATRRQLADAEERARRAEARRNRTRAVALGSAAAFTILIAIAVSVLYRETRLGEQVELQRDEAKRKQKESETVLAFLNDEVFGRATPENIPDFRVRDTIVKVMLEPAVQKIDASLSGQPLVQAAVQNRMAEAFGKLGRAADAEPLCRQSLEQRRKLLGENHPDTIASLGTYAATLRSLGRAAEAEPLARQALEQRRKVLGTDHPDTITSLSGYASVLRSLGRSAEAEPLARQVLEQRRKALGEEHADTITSLGSYASVLRSLGRSEEAEPLSRQALEQRRKVLGADHPDTIASLNSYAGVLESLGRSADAAPLYQQTLEQRRKVLGEDHPSTIASLNSYAGVLESLNRSVEAEPLYRQALEQRRKVLGEDHPSTITSLNNYADVLRSLGRATEAEPLCRQAMEKRRKLLGDDHPNTIASLSSYAGILDALGRPAEAETMYRSAFEAAVRNKSLGPAHASTRQYAEQYAALLDKAGRNDQAAGVRKQIAP